MSWECGDLVLEVALALLAALEDSIFVDSEGTLGFEFIPLHLSVWNFNKLMSTF
jgi:hypothetical protein